MAGLENDQVRLYHIPMNTQTIIEFIGYLGSFLVLVSFLMTSVFKLRIINTIGSVIFTIYALIIHSYPTAFMNICLVAVNLHFLWKMRHTGHEYDLVKVDSSDKYLNYLLIKQREDIEKCFPGIDATFDYNNKEIDRAYIVTCSGNPVGITMGHEEEGTLDLYLDYSFPEYRDFSIGAFLLGALKNDGIKKLVYSGPTEHHMDYLNKMGFKGFDGLYVKTL